MAGNSRKSRIQAVIITLFFSYLHCEICLISPGEMIDHDARIQIIRVKAGIVAEGVLEFTGHRMGSLQRLHRGVCCSLDYLQHHSLILRNWLDPACTMISDGIVGITICIGRDEAL